MRSSRKSPSKARTSYADSSIVLDEAMAGGLDNTVMGGLREESTIPRDSFGISYGVARKGIRQLRPYLQSGLNRTKTNGSMKSNDSRDSRFESADSLHQS
jgi:axial budding pattern protein 2